MSKYINQYVIAICDNGCEEKGCVGGTHRKSDFRWGRGEVKESPIENVAFKARFRESVNILR